MQDEAKNKNCWIVPPWLTVVFLVFVAMAWVHLGEMLMNPWRLLCRC